MKVIIPKTISTDHILEYNITENDHVIYDSTVMYLAGDQVMLGHRRYQAVTGDDIASIPVWSTATVYIAGAKCYVEATHKIYQCATDSTAQYPPNYLTGDTAVWTAIGYYNKGVDLGDTNFWLDIGPTNYYAMFDTYTDTITSGVLTSGLYTLDVTINTSKCNAVALFNCSGNTVQFDHYSPDNTLLLTKTVQILHRDTLSWSDYFFTSEYTRRSDIYQEIPQFFGTKLRVRITGNASASCGSLVIGNAKKLGASKYGASMSIADYSTKETNTFGVTYLSVGKYKKRATIDMYIERTEVDAVYKQLAALRAVPAVYICDNSTTADDMYEAMLIFGYYKDFSVVVSMYSVSDCSIEIEGLT